MTSENKNQPVYKIELAGFITIAVWKRLSKDGSKTFYSYGANRRYQDKNGKWQNSNTFSPQEWHLILPALDQAKQYVESALAIAARQEADLALEHDL